MKIRYARTSTDEQSLNLQLDHLYNKKIKVPFLYASEVPHSQHGRRCLWFSDLRGPAYFVGQISGFLFDKVGWQRYA